MESLNAFLKVSLWCLTAYLFSVLVWPLLAAGEYLGAGFLALVILAVVGLAG